MSTIVRDSKVTSPSLVKNYSKKTVDSRASVYSINSVDHSKDDSPSKRGRATVHESTTSSFFFGKKKTKKRKKGNKSQDIAMKSNNQTDATDEFSMDDYFEGKLERKRTHRSPKEMPRRRSNWKCDLRNLEDEQIKIESAARKLGLS